MMYSFVARGKVMLAEYIEFIGNFSNIASQCLKKLPASNNRVTYNCDDHIFNFLAENGFRYLGSEEHEKEGRKYKPSRAKLLRPAS
ncbi:putative vesicle-associated membrane protein 726 [Nicotiana attenuata]|uniref:Vesicle-associated membrane protein 726 n=1 Tax=Nicotiana attenuata TaxID=49451 RepID=A0A1J6KFR5_NICAT|nr:putative vesicle-associated membrane protein 726 [Nicotiana attenuata]